MKDKIEHFFDQWYATWSFEISHGQGKNCDPPHRQLPTYCAGRLPPYVDILVSHTKLSTYCAVVNHPTASNDVKHFFRAAGLTSALNVMRAAVDGEARLKSMPNNTVIMVSFAACFALGLSMMSEANNMFAPQNTRGLIEKTATVLERIGSTPPHRNGASALFGKHIQKIVERSVKTASQVRSFRVQSRADELAHAVQSPQMAMAPTPSMTYDTGQHDFPVFGMTDDQIIEAIENARNNTDVFQQDFHIDESLFLDWLDWPNLN